MVKKNILFTLKLFIELQSKYIYYIKLIKGKLFQVTVLEYHEIISCRSQTMNYAFCSIHKKKKKKY